MKIGVPLSKFAYTPESYAYEKYLTNLGHIVELDYSLNPNNDVNLYFMGTHFFWEKKQGNAKEIHEYQSLSTPPLSKMKNSVKKRLNKQPDARIFLNNLIYKDMNFKDNIPYIYRDMGIDENLFQTPSTNPKYDVIYCGSISGRKGLIEALLNISRICSVLVVGKISEEEKILLNVNNLTLMGAVNRDSLPEIYRNARFGLNYTPDIYPYNVQTSTKTLEYLASGLGVISNKYEWSERFFKEINYQPIWLDSISSSSYLCLDDFEPIDPSIVNEYSWSNILFRSNLENFLRDCLNEQK